MKHSTCKCCHRTSLNLSVNSTGYCTQKCSKLKDKQHFLNKNALPVWKDEKGVHFNLPDCITSLSTAEKMLIQKFSPIVPMHHLKYGNMGITGHCCAFEADIVGFVNTLPRQKNDVTLLRVLKKVKAEIGDQCKEYEIKSFRVRKQKVYDVLIWLRQHNSEYKDIDIDMSALDWLGGNEGSLGGLVIESEDVVTATDNTPQNSDIGPAPKQARPPKQGDVISTFGYIDEGANGLLSQRDTSINHSLRESVSKSDNKKMLSVDWPIVSEKAVSEFSDKRLFVGAFPWLFPGGIGDAKDYPGSLKEWGKHMLYYEDGRFAKDDVFCFFALNHIVRMRNSGHGRWFIDNFHKGLPDTLDEVKEKIEAGDTSFVNSLFYYNQNITGSSPYWFKKRCELYQWINHHVEIGNGPPSMFITLSCAEYLWADIIEKIKERMDIAGEDSSQCFVGSKRLASIVNQYSIVVQEYFQKRVTTWLDTVGKTIFKIKHYWVRYEFAPGRGQIHAHLLAIPDNHDIYELCHADLQYENGEHMRTTRLARWAEQNLGLTASVGDNFDDLNTDEESHVAMRFTDVHDMEDTNDYDFQMLMKEVQVHLCSGFCMRTKNER